MTCETSRELIERLVTDGLEASERARLDEHLETCGECTAVLEDYAVLWDDLGAALAPEPSDRARARLADAVAAAREKRVGERGGQGSGGREGANGGRPAWLRVAASFLIFAAGAAAGLMWPGDDPEGVPPESTASTYLVLMRGDSEQPTEEALNTWLAGLVEEGRFVEGAQLAETDGAWYGPPPEPFAVEGLFELFGYMIIEAEDLEAARAIAQSSPHISRTGAVEIWPIR